MYEKILVIDDDFGTMKLIETVLKKNNFNVAAYTSPIDALNHFNNHEVDLIISDFYLPQMSGIELLKKIRKVDEYIPFIVITVNKEIKNIINILKEGADDYIQKPIINEDLIFRVMKTISEKKYKKISDRVEKEKAILEFDRKQLVNWKLLYATKDVKQTKNLIHLITRNINQGGGFIWLDLLKNNIQKLDEKHYQIKKNLVDMIIKSTEENQKFFDSITYLSNLESYKYNYMNMTFGDFQDELINFSQETFTPIFEKYHRNFNTFRFNELPKAILSVDYPIIKKVIHELLVNAIKYSPDDSEIVLGFERNNKLPGKKIDVIIKNKQKEMGAKNLEGNKIIGIPYEYSELVFDLFYTIEKFPRNIDEEEWINGTGLYICRKIITEHSGWLETTNEIDYTKENNEVNVKFSVTLPIEI